MSLLDTASLIVTPNGYEEGKLFSVIPSDGSGDLSVVRATTATRVNSAGLVELVPYNLLQQSENFTTTWAQANSISVSGNTAIAPNGTLTADTLSALMTASVIRQVVESSSLSQYVFSVWIKKASGNPSVRLRIEDNVVPYNSTSIIVVPTDQWVRYQINRTTGSNVNSIYADIFPDFVNGTGSIYVWGAQLVEGSIAKDYQKTETRLNIPRLDYSNGTCPSILVEPQRTNLNLFSEQFDNGAYSSGGGAGSGATFTTNYGIAPDGNQTADRFQITRGSNYWERYQRKTTTIGKVYTLSFWGKAVTGTPTLYTAWNTAYQNPVTFTNEWVRYTYTYTAAGTSTGFNLITWVNLAGTSATADVMVWGIQLEQGSYATSYIPTTSASVTRNVDLVAKTGISSLIGQTEGVAYIDFDFNSKITSNGVVAFSIDGGAGNEMYILIYSNGNIVWEMYNSGLAQGSITGNIGSFGRKKIALAYKLNDCALYSNGTLIGTDTAATIPAMSRVYLGGFYSSTAYNLSAGINSFVLWKTRLTNTQLAQLTSI